MLIYQSREKLLVILLSRECGLLFMLVQVLIRGVVHEIAMDHIKNHWTKHTLVCTHFDAFVILLPNVHT